VRAKLGDRAYVDLVPLCLAGEGGLRIGEIRALKWREHVDLVAGTITVDGCAIPGSVILGSCSLSGSADEGSWGFEQRHYSVAATIDSDAAFKRCARFGGKWSAPDPNSPEIANARLQQHAKKLQEVADPERLQRQIKALQNIANGN